MQPVSGAGQAAAGYDRVMTTVKWTFAGSLSETMPHKTGTVGTVVRIR